MKLKLIASVLVLMVALTGVLGATSAYFSDYGTSIGNTFTAGSLDLQVNGTDENVRLFNLSDIHPEYFVVPGNQPKSQYSITNTGSIKGYLNIKDIVITTDENGLKGPESRLNDTDARGELGDFLNIDLFIDADKSGWWSTGDVKIYGGLISNMPDKLYFDNIVNPGGEIDVVAVIVNWWSDADDNLAQTDKVTIDLKFTLDQKAQTPAPTPAPTPAV